MKRNSHGEIGLARSAWPCLLIAFALSGCAQKAEIPFEQFSPEYEAYVPQPGSGNAYDGYLIAAKAAAESTAEFADQASFRDHEKTKYIQLSRNAVNQAIQASRNPCRIEFRPSDPFLPRPSHQGLTTIGRALAWRIERALAAGNSGEAANLAAVAFKIGTDLTGGDVQDALLGHWIVGEARNALAPALAKMNAGSLTTLGNRTLEIISNRPSTVDTLNHEEASMLAGVQFVQDAYQRKDFELMRTAMYKEVRPAMEYLQSLNPDDRPAYFRGFASEAKARVDHAKKQLLVARPERKEFEIDDRAQRPWKRFAEQLFDTLGPFVRSDEIYVARTRLFGLTCLALAAGKSTGEAPADLLEASAENALDPFTGRPFIYRRAGREFRLYSVGEDMRDDGGESDETGRTPDLLLAPISR